MTSDKSKLVLPSAVVAIEEVIEYNIKAGLKSNLNALNVVNRIITKGANILYSRYLNSKLPGYLADYYFGALTELVIQDVRAYDPGESVDSMIFNWNEDEEPKAVTIDTWGGFCVDVKKPPAHASTEGPESLVSLSDSIRAFNSRAQQRSRGSKRLSSVTQAIKKIIPRNSEFQSAEKEALWFREEAKIEIKKLQVEEEVEDKKMQEARRHIEQKRKFEQQKSEEAQYEKKKGLELQEKIRNFEKQKKEHGFTMDYDGNIILMNKPNPSRRKDPQTYNLDIPLQTIEKPAKGDIIRHQSEEDDKKKLSLISTPGLVTEDRSDLTKTMKFRNMFDAKPGITLTMNHNVKSKSQTPIKNRMKREEFVKILDNRKNERRAQRLLQMNGMQEDEILGENQQKKESSEENLVIQIKQLSKTNANPAVKIHNEDDFVQMLIRTPERNQRQQHLKTPKSHRDRIVVKVPQPQEDTQIEFFETRIINYEPVLDSGMKNVDLNKIKPAVPVPKIQQALDNYNRRLMRQESWGNGAPRSNAASTPRISRGVSVERRVQQKITTLDHHLAKEPRERITVGQKKAIKDKDLMINLDSIANKFAVGSFTTRNPESQNRQFLIRTSNSKSRLAGIEKESKEIITNRENNKGNKPEISINLSKVKSNSSMMTVSKSLQTARARINN